MKSKDKRESEIEKEMKKVETIENKMKEMNELYNMEEEERAKNMKSNDKKESENKEEMTNAVKKDMKEDEEIVDMRYMNEGAPKMMIISKHTTKSVVSRIF